MNEDFGLTLNETIEGESVTIKELMSLGSMRRRLLDIGLIEGTSVIRLNSSPSGDPTAYMVRGAVIALRSETSQNIVVER